jgi:hypothetical protein
MAANGKNAAADTSRHEAVAMIIDQMRPIAGWAYYLSRTEARWLADAMRAVAGELEAIAESDDPPMN